MPLGGKLVKFDIIGVVIIVRGALRTREMADSLIDAAKKSNVALVKELIGRGVDVNGVDDVYGYTALDWAAREGFVECAKVLLEANADVNKTDGDGWAPLLIASWNGRAECVKVGTFSFVMRKSHTFVVQLLIDWKANVNAKTITGSSPLHLAAERGLLACVEVRGSLFHFLPLLRHTFC